MEVEMELELNIPVNYLTEDFQEIEVEKKLAVHGDDLLLRIKKEYLSKTYKFGNMFCHKILYMCKGVENGKAIFAVVKE